MDLLPGLFYHIPCREFLKNGLFSQVFSRLVGTTKNSPDSLKLSGEERDPVDDFRIAFFEMNISLGCIFNKEAILPVYLISHATFQKMNPYILKQNIFSDHLSYIDIC